MDAPDRAPDMKGELMDEARHSVKLAEGAPFDPRTGGVVATLSRSEIERAARSQDVQVELMLEITRDTPGAVEEHSLAVSWDPRDLERLLDDTSGEDVEIAFDSRDLELALASGPDVEAHGLRERALILTVVAATAVASPAVASARTVDGPIGAAGAPAVMVGGAVSAPDVAGAPATTVGGATTADPTSAPPPPAVEVGGAGPAPAPPSEATPPPAVVTGGAGRAPVSPAVPADGTGTVIPMPSAGEAAIIGGVALTITAAGFAAAASRRRPTQST
jgi:hypothetical protein